MRRRAAWVAAAVRWLLLSVAGWRRAGASAFYEDLPPPLLARGFRCTKLPLPPQFFAEDRGLFNPAAAFHAELGWLVCGPLFETKNDSSNEAKLCVD